ncbi:hypothetical protein QQ045_010513 [Rhodiola kirilowii]
MEAILLEHDNKLPPRELFVTLAEKFSNGPERFGKSSVQMKQVMNWFQNKRYAIKAKSNKAPQKIDVAVAPLQAVPAMPPSQAPVLQPPLLHEVNSSPTSNMPRSFAPQSGKALNNMEFEARSARDGAWYDVAAFLSVRSKDTDDPEVLVRFVGLTPEEDEWIKVSKDVRHRSLPCEASECVAVLPGDLILCFQEAPEQALYFDAHVLDAQRLKHDSRGCRCRFLVRYDHDQFQEVVPLRKICRRPETDYRLQIYQALRDLPAQQRYSAPAGGNSQAESVPTNEKVEDNAVPTSAIQQKMMTFPSSPDALEKKTTVGSLEEVNAGYMADESASKAARRAEEILDQYVATKKVKETPEAQPVTSPVTLEANKLDKLQDPAPSKDATTPTMSKDLNSSGAVDGAESGNPNQGGVALSCQNQTNGHNHNGGSREGSSDVPVGAQQCF